MVRDYFSVPVRSDGQCRSLEEFGSYQADKLCDLAGVKFLVLLLLLHEDFIVT